MGGVSEAIAWTTSSAALPDPPDASVIPFLEAALRAVERFGWGRTTMRDIAREAGVERTTVYRHVGSVSDVYRLMVAHELHKLVDSIPASIPSDADGPAVLVEVLASAVEYCTDHPALTKVVADEPELLSTFLLDAIPQILERLSELIAPMVQTAMEACLLARRDPVVVTQWVARIGLSLLAAPPPGPLRPFLDELLRPALDPGSTS